MEWQCTFCTYVNPEHAGTICGVCCKTRMQLEALGVQEEQKGGWTCGTCSYISVSNLKTCEMCAAPREAVLEEETSPLDEESWTCVCTCINTTPVCTVCGECSLSERARRKEEDDLQFRLTARMEEMEKELEEAKRGVDVQTVGLQPLKEEAFALESGVLQRVAISPPSRHVSFRTEELLFRTAESQFLRYIGGQSLHLHLVEYVINPPLWNDFHAASLRLGEPVLAFHGTADANIDKIVENNFDVSKSRRGCKYGAGVYFSEYSSTSLGYSRGKGGKRMLLCRVLLGKSFVCKTLMTGHGNSVKEGFDSHVSADGNEIVIFDACQILPCFVLHFKSGAPAIGLKA